MTGSKVDMVLESGCAVVSCRELEFGCVLRFG